jgi:hypothetical protein
MGKKKGARRDKIRRLLGYLVPIHKLFMGASEFPIQK